MATSSKAATFVSRFEKAYDEIHLPSGLDKLAVFRLLEWVNRTTMVHDIGYFYFHGTLAEAIQLQQAAEELGMDKYTAGMLHKSRAHFLKALPTDQELAIAEILCNPRMSLSCRLSLAGLPPSFAMVISITTINSRSISLQNAPQLWRQFGILIRAGQSHWNARLPVLADSICGIITY